MSNVGVFLTSCLDTPWDEPTDRSPEFCRYLSGEIFNEEPWTKFGTNALCTSIHPFPCRGPIFYIALISGMLTLEAEKRMTMSEIYAHPWFTR